MKKDPLERFIAENRDAFDAEVPGPGIWDGIEAKLDSDIKPAFPWKRLLGRAAPILSISGLSWYMHDVVDRNVPATKAETPASSLAEYAPEAEQLLEAEAFYTEQISEMQDQLFSLTTGKPDVWKEIDAEISDLDSVYVDLKRDLRDNAANEEIIEAMIQHYRLKIAILSDILLQLQEEHNTAEEVHYEI